MGDEKVEDLKGRAKEAAGDLTDDDELKRKGKLDQASASVKEKVGDAGEKVEEGVETVKDKVGEVIDRDN
jgi:uncharacterized protein YjbJ (UPF0337 family)